MPEAAPWCFKLSFAWYINALFNLNPFLALDGYYLVMDWLEVPNLRARGLSWVVARLRRRPPAWSALDREGRLVALYGLLAVGWLVIALNIGYRVYVDRVGGLITGLWRVRLAGPGPAGGGRGGADVAGGLHRLRLVGPPVAPAVARGRGAAARPRRARAGSTPCAPRACVTCRRTRWPAWRRRPRWVHPRTGRSWSSPAPPQPYVYAVVDGALEARAPATRPAPCGSGSARVAWSGWRRPSPGAPSPLSWYTAGTRLLAIPSTAVAAAVGPAAAGHRPAPAAEAERLFAESPALAGLSYEDRLGLAPVARPIALAPGAPVVLDGADEAIVVAAGVIATPDGQQLGRGTLIGPAGVRQPRHRSRVARIAGTPVQPAGRERTAAAAGHAGRRALRRCRRAVARAGRPITGVHPVQGYPPLAAPPGPPPPRSSPMWTAGSRSSCAGCWSWSCCSRCSSPAATSCWRRSRGPRCPRTGRWCTCAPAPPTVMVDGVVHNLTRARRSTSARADTVRVGIRSRALMTYHGGAASVLCAGTVVRLGPLMTSGEPPSPSAASSWYRAWP